jgi:hypothetical protein
MALSEDTIYEIAEAYGPLDSEHRRAEFARAIETEVRKEYTELIRQMRDALETCDSADGYNGPYQFHDDKAVEAAINAARARLGEKT